jgi:hypothetical protein
MSETEMAEFFRELAEDRRLRSVVNTTQTDHRSYKIDFSTVKALAKECVEVL